MGSNQIYKLLYSKGNHKQNEKVYKMGQNIFKQCNHKSLIFKTQTAHAFNNNNKNNPMER